VAKLRLMVACTAMAQGPNSSLRMAWILAATPLVKPLGFLSLVQNFAQTAAVLALVAAPALLDLDCRTHRALIAQI
jgi:hypothetical protein